MEDTRLFFSRRAFVTSQGKTADVVGSGSRAVGAAPCGSEAQPTVDTRPRGALCMGTPSPGAVCMGTPSPDELPLPLRFCGT